MFARTKLNAFYKVLEKLEAIKRNKQIGYAYLVEDHSHKHFVVGSEEIDSAQRADTLEELSDCFVAVDKNGKLCEDPMASKGHCFKSFCNYYKAKGLDVDCYLAILTAKGLTFIGKMNDKGELELL